MIKSIEIENFKCFGKPPALLRCAPITLLYGPNSAGKSTVCQAARILYEQLVAQAETKGPGICRFAEHDIGHGSFKRLVHGHDAQGSMQFRIEWPIHDLQAPCLDSDSEEYAYGIFVYATGVLKQFRLGYGTAPPRFTFSLAAEPSALDGWFGMAEVNWTQSRRLEEYFAALVSRGFILPKLNAAQSIRDALTNIRELSRISIYSHGQKDINLTNYGADLASQRPSAQSQLAAYRVYIGDLTIDRPAADGDHIINIFACMSKDATWGSSWRTQPDGRQGL